MGGRSEGLIYYVLDANRRSQYLKIGYSAKLAQRVRDLREITTSLQSPTVLALEEGGIAEERSRHAQFAELRTHGEWFRYEGRLIEFVASMEHPHGYLLDRPHLWQFADGWGPLCSHYSARTPKASTSSLDENRVPLDAAPMVRFPLRPGRTISPEGYEVGPDGLPPIDF